MIRVFGLILLAGLAACSSSSRGPSAEADDPAERQASRLEGARLAEAHCARCHAQSDETPSPNPAAPPFPQLHQRYPDTLLADAFPQRMAVGHPSMPRFEFSSTELGALLDYLQSIQAERGA